MTQFPEMAVFAPPAKFNFQDASGWGVWIRTFKTFRKATKLHKDPEDEQIASLLYCMGPEAEDIHATFQVGAEVDTFEKVVEAFDKYFQPKKNVLRLRRAFHERNQEEENLESFLRHLYVLSENCEFANRDEAIRDRFVSGLKDKDLAQKLEILYMSKSSLTLQELVDYAKTHEEIRGANMNRASVERVQQKKTAPKSFPEKQASGPSYRQAPTPKGKGAYGRRECTFCGYNHAPRK